LTPRDYRVISSFVERTRNAEQQHLSSAAVDSAEPPTRTLLHRSNPLGELPLMKSESAVEALGALAQELRLSLFRLLVRAGNNGMAAGAIADALGVPNSSLSFHLSQLRNAGLIVQERQHRSLIYRANYSAMNALVAYLMENCCAGADCGPNATCENPPHERKSA
jgi:DNA-binding transcriptional ArsR family regulator